MAVQITAPELAEALAELDVHKPDMTDQELAECLLVAAIVARLQRRMASASGEQIHKLAVHAVAATGRETGQ